MASPLYIHFTDDHGSPVRASVSIKGREGAAEGHAFDYEVSIPADRNTGALMGIRRHDNVILTKSLDNASPVLFDACCKGKTLKRVQLDWYRINESGVEEVYFTHTLTDVKVVRVRHFMDNMKRPENDLMGHQEEVHLRFRRIELCYPNGNIRAMDDWIESRSSAVA